MWVAKDKDVYLSAYNHKPIRGYDEWSSAKEDTLNVYDDNGNSKYCIGLSIPLTEKDYDTFSDLRWEDEPIEVKIVSTIIDERKLDEIANAYYAFDYSVRDEIDYGYGKTIPDAFKAGYRKAKEE